MEELYRVELADGTEITNLKRNGDNFISETPVEEAQFAGNCSPVKIYQGEELIETHEHMALIQSIPFMGEYWFALRDLSNDELVKIKMQSDIEYIAMMTDVEL